MGDHWVLLAAAGVQGTFLLALGGRDVLGSVHLWAAGALFAVMIVIDASVPHHLTLRLTLEDLAKTWSAFFFALFAWSHVRDHVRENVLQAAESASS
jgi:hypothetical protein